MGQLCHDVLQQKFQFQYTRYSMDKGKNLFPDTFDDSSNTQYSVRTKNELFM